MTVVGSWGTRLVMVGGEMGFCRCCEASRRNRRDVGPGLLSWFVYTAAIRNLQHEESEFQ